MEARSTVRAGDSFIMSALSPHSPEDVSEELIGRLYSTQQHVFSEFISTMTEEQRAHAALVCYGRVHLREIALVLAATCERTALIEAAGKIMGDILFTQARAATPVSSHSVSRKPKITLASVASTVALDAATRAAIAEPEDSEADAEDDESSAP
jgi:hypothetical protein